MHVEAPDVEALVDWLVDGAPGACGPAEVLAMAGPRIVASHVPLVRIGAFVRTLHPQIMGRSFVWQRDAPEVVVGEAPYSILTEDTYLKSPSGTVFQTGQELRRRLDGSEPLDMDDLRKFAARGYTDYLVLPMRFLDGQVHAVTYATDQPGGFREADIHALRRVTRPLARICEILALRRTAVNLLSAYVGRGAGERILLGKVQRGDTERFRCVFWCSDLRGFTSLTEKLAPEALIGVLNRLFDCQVPAVADAGGEVLKFIGDGMLAIFPIAPEAGVAGAADAARRALGAANAALSALDASNARVEPEDALAFGIALHVGEVAYGNIGSLGRLDFTCIGPAVNVAARLEGLTGPLKRRLLLSADFSALLGGGTRLVGTYALKGVAAAQDVYEPTEACGNS